MKKTQMRQWREKDNQQVEAELKTLSAKLTSAYLTKSAGKLQNVAMIKNIRRDIAWLKTIMGERAEQPVVSES
ncbi:50S ribosomal protein L29 [bacterium]|nr:50S ribosomal protein L29 [bacterium]